jgi:hypothetical protein
MMYCNSCSVLNVSHVSVQDIVIGVLKPRNIVV